MKSTETMIQQLEDARRELWIAINDFLPQQEIYPGWTLKDMLAHLTGWDEAVIATLRAHLGDLEANTPAARGIDLFNAESVETRKMLTFEQISVECNQAREQVKAILRTLPPHKLEEKLVMSWGRVGTVAEMIGVFVHHERQHAAEIGGRLK